MTVRVVPSCTKMAMPLYTCIHQSLDAGHPGKGHDLGWGDSLQLSWSQLKMTEGCWQQHSQSNWGSKSFLEGEIWAAYHCVIHEWSRLEIKVCLVRRQNSSTQTFSSQDSSPLLKTMRAQRVFMWIIFTFKEIKTEKKCICVLTYFKITV